MKNFIKDINPFNNKDSKNKITFLIKILLKYYIMYFVGLIVAEIVVIILHYILGYDPFAGNLMSNTTMLLFKYYGYVICIFTVIIFVKVIDKENLKTLGFNKKVIDYFKGAILSIISLGLIIIILMFFNKIKFIGINETANYKLIILFFGAFIVQGMIEEVLARGFLLKRLLSKKLNLNLCIFISFVLFAYPHFSSLFENNIIIEIFGVINLLLITYVFSYLAIKYDNIYASSGFHSIWNFVLFSIIGLNLSGTSNNYSLLSFAVKPDIIMGGEYGIEGSFICSIVLLILVIILNKSIKKRGKNGIN